MANRNVHFKSGIDLNGVENIGIKSVGIIIMYIYVWIIINIKLHNIDKYIM